MALISIYKVVSSVPSSLDANALYLVRTGAGFDLYVSDSTGSVAYQINSSGALLNVVEDTTPQLGGDLDLNGNDITGTGNISIAGEIEADIHIGSLRGEIQFKAKAGEALTKGDPVYISSYDTVGNTPIVAIADANDSAKMPCFGLANESVSLNASVNVVIFGTLSGLDTSSFSLGDTLYISNTGTLTNSKPTGESSLIQNIGKVQRVDNSSGSIKVGGAGRTNDVPNLDHGNVFIGNASNQAETRGLTLDDIEETPTNKHFTSGDESKLNGIAAGAEVNVNADWNAVSGDAQILNKPATITSAEQAKLGNISITQAVDLDAMESNVEVNNAKISNATHTGDVTGSTDLTISDEAVTNPKMAHVATGTVKGRATAGTGDVEDLDIDTTLKSALNLSKTDVGLGAVPNTDCTDASNISSGTLSINRLPSGINADRVDGLEASQFLRSDAGDTLNVGRGGVYLESNSLDNQNGAGLTLRTSVNPALGSEGTVGAIFSIRALGSASKFWVGLSETTTGTNDFVTKNATFKGNVTIHPNQGYYLRNNSNVFHGTNSTDVTPTPTDTAYYAIFDSMPVTNTDIYTYTAPTASSNTGIKLLQAGKYKVSYTLNWQNVSYANRVNFYSSLVKHSSAITPTETTMAGSRSFAYARADDFASFATTTNVTVIDVEANEFIKCKTKVAKGDTTFDDNFNGLAYHENSSIVIEFLGNI